MNQPDLLLHNTLTGRKEPFVPLKKGEVGMYVCGITPYDDVHLGHARCYVVFDVVRRVLESRGFKVRFIQNFTDVDDKIIEQAKKQNKDPLQFPEPLIKSYFQMMDLLNVKKADAYPRVTQSIPIIIDLIQKLVQRGMAYEAVGSVYYAVRKFSAYGQLSKRKIDELESGARVEVDTNKKDALDFALWKASKEGEPSWPSPWGPGRPGWHIECSAMSMQHLGEEFDIHGGGQDLIFPHHENEIAQSVGGTGKPFVHTWLHNGFVTINKEKMSKSLGNFFALKDIFAKVEPMVVRYFLLTQHYRHPLNFSDADLAAAESAWTQRIGGAFRLVMEHEKGVKSTASASSFDSVTKGILEEFDRALNDDVNTPGALGALNKLCSLVFELDQAAGKAPKTRWGSMKRAMTTMLDVLGLKVPVEETWDKAVLDLVAQREEARRQKNWAKSDEIRQALKARGVAIDDTATTPRLKRIH
ncbi:MAG: cysteine--tRNA ligase [Elusimicrobia bacterium]|nr:cysteine--tRNA ligase [Candidatus Obscuribacterium magneticum]